jgi:hypothetical protein
VAPRGNSKVDAQQRAEALAAGEARASCQLYFGFGGGSLPLLLGGIALGIGISRRK